MRHTNHTNTCWKLRIVIIRTYGLLEWNNGNICMFCVSHVYVWRSLCSKSRNNVRTHYQPEGVQEERFHIYRFYLDCAYAINFVSLPHKRILKSIFYISYVCDRSVIRARLPFADVKFLLWFSRDSSPLSSASIVTSHVVQTTIHSILLYMCEPSKLQIHIYSPISFKDASNESFGSYYCLSHVIVMAL